MHSVAISPHIMTLSCCAVLCCVQSKRERSPGAEGEAAAASTENKKKKKKKDKGSDSE